MTSQLIFIIRWQTLWWIYLHNFKGVTEHRERNPSPALGDQGMLLEEMNLKLRFEKWVRSLSNQREKLGSSSKGNSTSNVSQIKKQYSILEEEKDLYKLK